LHRRSYTTTGTIGVWTDVDELEDVDAVLVFNVDFEPADPSVGALESGDTALDSYARTRALAAEWS